MHKPETILAAASIAFRDEGVSVTTARIAEAAGVSNGTLFNYFPTKQDLIDALYLWLKSDLAEAIGEIDPQQSPRSQMHLIWDRWLTWTRAHPDRHGVMQLLHRSGLVDESVQAEANRLFHVPTRVLADARAVGLFVDLPTIYLAELMEQHLGQAAAAGLDGASRELAFDVMWNGITTQSRH